MNQTFERIVDQKDSIIQSLVKDLEEAEDQYQTAIKSHLYNIQKLLGIIYIDYIYVYHSLTYVIINICLHMCIGL